MPKARLLPPASFDRQSLTLWTVAPGEAFFRCYPSEHHDPLGRVPGPSRFGDPDWEKDTGKPYAVFYLGASFEVAVLEAVVRDTGLGVEGDAIPIDEAEFERRTIAEITVDKALRLVDLRGGGPVAMRIPTDAVRAQDHALGMAWSAAIHRHPATVDGIAFPSRLNGQTNLAVFERAIPKLGPRTSKPLMEHEADLAALLDTYRIALTPASSP